MMASASSLSDIVSIFPNAYEPIPCGQATVPDILQQFKSGKYSDQIRVLRQFKDKESDAYKKKKNKLPAVTFSGSFPYRNKENVETPTGFLTPDIDHLSSAELESLKQRLSTDQFCHAFFVSPSGDGLKALFRTDGIKNDDDIKRFFEAVRRYFLAKYQYEIDPACKDIGRLTYVSYDPDTYINPDADLFPLDEWLPEPDPEPERKAGPSSNSYSDAGHDRRRAYGAKVLETASAEIASSIPKHQHETRIRVAYKIGGFIASGFIDENVALDMLEDAVRRSGAKDMKASMKDITDGISKGKLKPIYPDLKQDDPGQYYEDTEQQGPPEDDYVPPGEERQAGGEQQKKNRGRILMAESAFDILQRDYPEPEYLIPGLLPKNHVNLFGAKPKTGKSTMTENHAIAFVSGGYVFGNIPVEQCSVLMLALEDQPRRFKANIKKMLMDGSPDALKNLHVCFEIKKFGAGGEEELTALMDKYQPKLLVVDTLKKIKADVKTNGKTLYDIDYESIDAFRPFSEKYDCTIIVITHLRKMASDDPFDCFSGSLGLTAAADSMWTIQRCGTSLVLYGRGRDMYDFEKAVKMHPETLTWEILGDASDVLSSNKQQAIFDVLKATGEPMKPKAIHAMLSGISYDSVRQMLKRMFTAGKVDIDGRGMYTIHPSFNNNNKNSTYKEKDKNTSQTSQTSQPSQTSQTNIVTPTDTTSQQTSQFKSNDNSRINPIVTPVTPVTEYYEVKI